MTHQKPAGELSGGLFVFARGAMHRQLLPAADGEREFWKRPSPSRLRRATSPERERLWQGRKVYRLTAGFFLPLTGVDETCPLCQGRKVCSLTADFFLPLTGENETYPLCQGLALRESCRRRRLRGFVLETAPSPQATERVRPPSPPHLSYTQKTARADARAVFAKFLEKAGGAFSFLLTPAPGERRSAGRDTRRHRRGYRPGRRCPHPPAAAGA